MSINQTCEDIVRVVNFSKLDYQMNQTPYSMHFSIRKKFLKGHNPNFYISPEVTKDLEIFHLKQEYQKLYDLYQIALVTEANLTSDLSNLKTEADALRSDLTVAREDLAEKEDLAEIEEKNKSLKKSVENADSKKEKKVNNKQKISLPINISKKKLKSVETDIIMEAVSNQTESKVILLNVPVSNRFSILYEDEPPPLSKILSSSESKLSSITSLEVPTSSATRLLSTSEDTSGNEKSSETSNKTKAELSKLLLIFSQKLDDSIELMNQSNFFGGQAK